MEASKEPPGPSHFTVHVFLNHDPLIARVLLPDLFLDFPDSSWKLAPLVEPPPPPREKPEYKSLPKGEGVNPREGLGRYTFSEPLAGDTTLLQLAEKYTSSISTHFILATTEPPQDHQAGRAVLHLVLEIKAAALQRIVGTTFLQEEIRTPYCQFVGYWNRLDGFWHRFGTRWQSGSQLESNLGLWRCATFAFAYLARQQEKGLTWPDDNELRTSVQRAEELREKRRQSDLSDQAHWDLTHELLNLLPRIRQIERNKAGGHDQLRDISVFVTQWEDWVTNQDFQNFTIRLLKPDEVESKVAAVIRQARRVVDEWRPSEGRQQLHASIKEEYYGARPWLTEEDRANDERYRLDELKHAAWLPNPTVWGAGNTSADNSVISSPHIQVHSMRRSDGTLLPDPSASSFMISSGSILWGQMVSLYSTMSHSDFTQNADAIPPELQGGTILQHRFRYRSAARHGQWKVRPYNERIRIGRFLPDPDGPGYLAGWILHHEDVDPGRVLERVRALDGTGPGADVLYVGRYDWSHHSMRDLELEFQQWAEPVIGPVPDIQDPYNVTKCNVRKGGYMIAMDEADFNLNFAAAYKRDCDRPLSQNPGEANHAATPIEKVFRKDGRNFGTFLSMMYSGEDYAWLVFSGEKHADHGVDELVALVYSSGNVTEMYHTLEGDLSSL
ncbi:predicted protein [Chaetomium globosum CBS 148.51]|uniref:Uncharacterized protein n=1 Tax=Chaetomium globosum (strain ATCC 6205 / CBS 148.51 / DSM 1962 / NBRC 6347 / NRRL 1970) TaxID=306901 RepID=Q2HEU8_CHAGB|nr:uncharacterized protein CHGG_01256 [Chaetomium globosum CBS 148.51]EAQ93021.1 predicted protein [Chaetomium globosum CBS 148.51]